jgi:hypothetical protein
MAKDLVTIADRLTLQVQNPRRSGSRLAAQDEVVADSGEVLDAGGVTGVLEVIVEWEVDTMVTMTITA